MSRKRTTEESDVDVKEAGVLDLGTGKFRRHGEKLEPATETADTGSGCPKKGEEISPRTGKAKTRARE
jgi:hypothetical protein